MRQKIYIDTSVVGGYFDREFEEDTRRCGSPLKWSLFDRILASEYDVHFSEISTLELSLAPTHVRELLNIIPPPCLIMLPFTDEARQLAAHYIEGRILGEASLNDAYHIAIATVNHLDVVVSWNFKHIVNLDKIILFNEVNRKYGYPTIDIRAPKELIKYED